jgi:hypothetical protein
MRRILFCLLAAGLSAGAGPLAAAQNVTAATQPKSQVDSTAQKSTRQTQFSMAAIDQSKKTDYKAAQAKAQKDYKDAMAKCQRRSSSGKRQCMTDAKATRTQALAQAKTQWENQK